MTGGLSLPVAGVELIKLRGNRVTAARLSTFCPRQGVAGTPELRPALPRLRQREHTAALERQWQLEGNIMLPLVSRH